MTGQADAITRLYPREREVAHLAAQGLTNTEIGRKLNISVDTVKTHMRRMMRKLGAANRAQVAALVLQAEASAHCACCRRAHVVLDTRRSLRGRIDDTHPWSRLYDDIRTALEETP
jgi:DNA-binding CsgD family transcriptional regulator